jgi:hypothetical protein
MFAVEIYAAIRRFVFVEGKSRREAARVFRIEPGDGFQDVPVFGAAWLRADQGVGLAGPLRAQRGPTTRDRPGRPQRWPP